MKIKLLQSPFCFISIILIFVFGFSLATAQQIELTKEEQQWIEEHPTIRAAGGTDYVPIQFMRNGIAAGLSIDYINLIAGKIGLNVEYVNGFTWEQHIEKINNKELDIISSISSTLGRDEFLNFSDAYVHLPYVYYGRAGSDPINNIKDLEGKRIGAIDGWNTTETYKNDYKHLILVEQSSSEEALQSLFDGSIDVFIVPEAIGDYIIRQNFITGLEIIGERFIPEIREGNYLQIGTRKDWPILNDIIKKGMAAVSEAEVNAIFEKWIADFETNNDFGLTMGERNWLDNNNVIKVATDPNIAPLEFIDEEGEISGLVGDYLRLIGNKLNIKFVWAENNNFTEGIEKIKQGKADIISAISLTEDRRKEFILTDSYVEARYMIFANENSQLFNINDDLSDLKLVQVKDYTVNKWLNEKYPNRNVITVDTIDQALQMISTRTADAYIGDIATTSYYIGKSTYSNIKVVGGVDYVGETVIAIRKDLPLLGSAIQKALDSISEKEKIEILNTWFSATVETDVNYKLLWTVIGIGLFIFFIILIWNKKLRKEVARRVLAEEELVIKHKEAEAARKIAEEASIAKSDFLTSMSHDLRTPLNAIIGFSETIKEEIFGPVSNKKYLEYGRDIHTSGEYLLQLVNDILDLSSLEANKRELDYEIIDMPQFVIECQSVVHKLAKDKNIDVTIKIQDDAKTLNADKKGLKQILLNLLSNSIKFTPLNGSITIRSEVSDENYIIHVIDTGFGISEEDINLIIEPFSKAIDSPLISHEEGTGLGLSIVKSLVDLHGGTLKINSNVGQGTTITVTLPIGTMAHELQSHYQSTLKSSKFA